MQVDDFQKKIIEADEALVKAYRKLLAYELEMQCLKAKKHIEAIKMAPVKEEKKSLAPEIFS